jgi:DNA-binding transcriptional LysR family regulator
VQPFFWVGPARAGARSSLVERLAAGEAVLRLAPGSGGRRLLDAELEAHGLRPKSTIDVPSVSLLLAYAAGGVGIGIVPGLALDGPPPGATMERAGLPTMPVRLALRKSRRSVPAVEHFIERLERHARPLGARLKKLPGKPGPNSLVTKPRRRPQ